MSNYSFHVHLDPLQGGGLLDVHSRVVSAVRKVDPPWGGVYEDDKLEIAERDPEVSALISFSHTLGRGVSGKLKIQGISGVKRGELDLVSFRTNKWSQSTAEFLKSGFSRYCQELSPVRALFYEVGLGIESSTFTNTDGSVGYHPNEFREEVSRIWQAEFWSGSLCKNAFNKSSAEIRDALQGHVEHVEELGGGVSLLVNSSELSKDEIWAIDGRLRPLLERKKKFSFV